MKVRSPDINLIGFALVAVAAFWAVTAPAGSLIQTDWSGGPTGMVVVTEPGDSFAQAESVSWLSVPGQIALSSTTLPSPLVTGLTNGAYQGAESVYATDIDGDGDVDIVAAAYPGDVSWWRNEGGDPVVWSRFVISSTFVGANQVHASDLDGDGDTDVAGAAYLSNNVSWWSNDGGAPIQWTKYVIASGLAGAWSVFSADVDGDGKQDLLAAVWFGGQLRWWRNSGGEPVGWTSHLLDPSLDGASAVHAADVDGDGALEVLAAAYESAEVVVYELTRFVEQGGSKPRSSIREPGSGKEAAPGQGANLREPPYGCRVGPWTIQVMKIRGS